MAKLTVDGIGGKETVKAAQRVFGTPVDGKITGQNKKLKKYYPALKAVSFNKVSSALVKRLQKWVGVKADGVWGSVTSKGLQKKLNSEGYDAGKEDSIFGKQSMEAFQRWLNEHDSPTPDTPTPSPTPSKHHLQKWFDALRTQYNWSKKQKYKWVLPTIANSKFKGTCISFPSVALQRLGMLPSKGYIYFNPDTNKIADSPKNWVKNHPEWFELYYPNKTIAELWKAGKIKEGDIIGFDNPNYHTMVFKGKNKDGDFIFDTMGGGKRGLNVEYPYYANRKVAMIVRLKKVK